MGPYGVQIVAIALLIVAQGYFVAAEIALVSARRTALQAAAERGSTGAAAAIRLVDDPTRLLSAISVAITLCGFGASAFTAVTFEEPVAAWFRSAGISWMGNGLASGMAVFVVTLLVTYVTVVFGELAPKRLGLQRAEKVAASVAIPITWLSLAVSPLIWVLSRSTDLVAPLIGAKPGQGKSGVTEEEIKLLVTEQGSLLDEEKRMIHEVFELGDTVAREIMVPRVDAQMLEDTLTVGAALPHFRGTGFSRMPVFHDDPDTVVGIALLKDLLGPIAAGRVDEPIAGVMRPPAFVPETKPILDLLQEMRGSHNHMVIVVDEHGGTAGVVTIEDIVEEVIGEIADEFDRDYRYINQVSDRTWLVDGRLPVEDANEKLGLDVPESEEYDTLAGWVLMELGHIPEPGERVSVDGAEIRVQAVRRRRIARLRVTRELPSGMPEA
ncbi:MAG: hemolysin family protein [Coriobacteriia bacterium]|nr:hemolysin family protein [Coriobacteriia bacterium]